LGRRPAIPTDPSFNPLKFWYDALKEDVGLLVHTTDRELFRRRMYQARLKEKDPTLDTLSLIYSPDNEAHVWIMKTDALPR
jgi:hypothetical protein